ncbi:three component ABC system middle component [Flavobacterium sp. ARAG 55.4]|uniref:three component ABC system middle component n=1 Tax=Flavobacterium sp. ARAG 55.4 TaxID=3451357 RepID=UPI003F471CA0
MNIAQTEKILFSPLFTSKLLLMALVGANNNKLKVELIYYILPLIYNDTIKSKLVKSNAKSTFNTFLNSEVKMELIVIETLLTNYKKKTKEALITLSNIYNIEISDYLILVQGQNESYTGEKDPILREYYKAAFNLGLILSKEDHKTIFFNL